MVKRTREIEDAFKHTIDEVTKDWPPELKRQVLDLYAQNPLLNLLLKNAGVELKKSPFTKPITRANNAPHPERKE